MKKIIVSLAMLFMISAIAIPSYADKLTLKGEYIGSQANNLIEGNEFNGMLNPHSLSLELGYAYNSTTFKLGVEDFDLGYSPAVTGIERYRLSQSSYVSIESDIFDFSYLRGDYPNYAFDPTDNIIGFNFIYQDLSFYDNDRVPNRGNYLLPQYRYSIKYHLTHKNLFRTEFSVGKLNITGYYFDSELVESAINLFNPYSDAIYYPKESNWASISGPAVNAKLSLSEYFNIGIMYSNIAYEYENSESLIETLSLDIGGALPFLSGEYFVVALKTNYRTEIKEEANSDNFAVYAGTNDLKLKEESKASFGLNYVFSGVSAKLAPSNDAPLGQAAVYTDMIALYDSKPYLGLHRIGFSAEFDFNRGLSLNLSNGIFFAKDVNQNQTDFLADITTIKFNYQGAEDNRFELSVVNDFQFIPYEAIKQNEVLITAFGQIDIGEYLEIGLISKNVDIVRFDLSPQGVNNFYGSTNIWFVGDFKFDLESSNFAEITLGGSIGVIYGGIYHDILDMYQERLGRVNYDAYAGISANMADKFGIKIGAYMGTNTYIAHALFMNSGNWEVRAYMADFRWKTPNLVATATLSYYITYDTELSLTGTYRNWEYTIGADKNSLGGFRPIKIEDKLRFEANTKYFLQGKVTFKPTENVKVSLALGQDGLAHEKVSQSSNVMPWDYLKTPISLSEIMNWKHIELNVLINF